MLTNANLLRKGLIENPGNGVITTLLRKGLIENGGINFKRLIPKPYRRDQPAQRLQYGRLQVLFPIEKESLT
ncbi:MAG: hypothetical protein PHP71_11155 [Methanosarcina sp.]|nr:hypothetical protein [Methanosarcina sp.]